MGAYRAKKPFSSERFQYAFEVDLQLESFSEYIKLTENTVELEIKNKIIEYDNLLKNASEEEVKMHNFNDHEVKIYVHQLYFNALFISLYSFLEKKMYQLCKLAEKDFTIKVNDLSDEGVFKYQKYLKKVVGINFDTLNTEWTEITKFNKLRNLMVHSPTTVLEKTGNFHKQITTLKSIKGLTIHDRGETIEFQISDKEVLTKFRSTIYDFLHEIYYEKG